MSSPRGFNVYLANRHERLGNPSVFRVISFTQLADQEQPKSLASVCARTFSRRSSLQEGGPADNYSWGTPVAGRSIQFMARGLFGTVLLVASCCSLRAAEPQSRRTLGFPGLTSINQRREVVKNLPLNRLTKNAKQRILSITKSPTLYRRLPTQDIECDKDMFLFLARNPEVLVGMWELMGITQVKIKRTGPYHLEANDGSGTTCKVDLIYGDQNVHIYSAEGGYEGRMTPKPIRGKGVFVLRSSYRRGQSGKTIVNGTLDCFVQFDSFGTDLVARTLGGIIGKSADSNYVETARFVQQISQASVKNPPAMLDIANRLPQVSAATRKKFAEVVVTVARRAEQPVTQAYRPPQRVATQRRTQR